MRATLVALAASVVLLAGCGDDTTTPNATPNEEISTLDPTETTTAPSLVPECGTVWKVGARLPGDYAGCLGMDGAIVDGNGTYCESGQTIFTNGKDMYAASGRKITKVASTLKKDEGYQATLKTCRG